MHILVKDLAVCERPYEKAERYGVSALSDAELLSLIMRTGTKEASVLDLANQVLNAHDTQKGLLGLQFLLPQELTKIPGVGKVKAIQLLALAEISKRMNLEQLQKKHDHDGLRPRRNAPEVLHQRRNRPCGLERQDYQRGGRTGLF